MLSSFEEKPVSKGLAIEWRLAKRLDRKPHTRKISRSEGFRFGDDEFAPWTIGATM